MRKWVRSAKKGWLAGRFSQRTAEPDDGEGRVNGRRGTIGDSFVERLFYYSGRGGKCQGAILAGLELVGEVIEAGFELGDAVGEAVVHCHISSFRSARFAFAPIPGGETASQVPSQSSVVARSQTSATAVPCH